VAVGCRAVGLSRSSYYYRPVQKDESQLKEMIQEIAAKYPTYGSRRIAMQLRRQPYGVRVNRKRVSRLMRELGLVRKPRRRRPRTSGCGDRWRCYPNLLKSIEVTRPDQVWAADITWIRLKRGYVYLAVVMDLFTRGVRGWKLSRQFDVDLTLGALKMALDRGIPQIHHSDQGVQYCAREYVELLLQKGIQISMAEVARPDQNGHAERLIRTIKEEEVNLSEYEGFWDALARIGEFIEDVYHKKRIHSALGYLTPEEFEAKWREQQIKAVEERWRTEHAQVVRFSKARPEAVQI